MVELHENIKQMETKNTAEFCRTFDSLDEFLKLLRNID